MCRRAQEVDVRIVWNQIDFLALAQIFIASWKMHVFAIKISQEIVWFLQLQVFVDTSNIQKSELLNTIYARSLSFVGYCNVGHIVGYKIGILCGGGILTALNSHISPQSFFFVIAIAYGISAAYFSKCSSQLFKSEGDHEAKSKTGTGEGESLRW